MEKKENIIKNKTYSFALEIVSLYKHLTKEKKEYVLSKQLLRSGTSIGANVTEADAAISRAEFSAKISIAYKVEMETAYWLNLLHDSKFISTADFNDMHHNCQAICKILFSINQRVESTDLDHKSIFKSSIISTHSSIIIHHYSFFIPTYSLLRESTGLAVAALKD